MCLSVSLKSLDNYRPEQVKDALHELLEPLGGMESFVTPGQKVLIKPNMLAGKSPEKAVTTHPEIVKQVIILAQNAGGIVSVGDSPGLGHPESVARKCGILEVIQATGAQFVRFQDSLPVRFKSGTFHQLEIAKEYFDHDIIINLPKLKTHQMMGFTGAVKNLFGFVVGARKAGLHLQAGTDKSFFALMLLELCDYINPALSIMDAVTAMEGDGPGSGDPINLGVILASKSPVALDTIATSIVNLTDKRVWTQKVARESGRTGTRPEEISLFGADVAAFKNDNFRPAKNADINFGIPAPLKNMIKNAISAQPEIMQNCQLCGQCVTHCPPQAMKMKNDHLHIDYKRCISCFCCQELCPHGAIATHQGLLLRLVEFIEGRRASS